MCHAVTTDIIKFIVDVTILKVLTLIIIYFLIIIIDILIIAHVVSLFNFYFH